MILHQDYYELAGKLKYISLNGYKKRHNLEVDLCAVLDFFGATGTSKDRLANNMITIAEESGKLVAGGPVIEACVGVFGIALTIAALRAGHPIHLIIPHNLPSERHTMLTNLGAKLHVCHQYTEPALLREYADRLVQDIGGYFTDYMNSDDNPEHHRKTTGPQILKATDGQFDMFIAGVGSGGTISGTGEYIKAWTSDVSIVAVQPFESRVLTGGEPSKHGIDGIGPFEIPGNYNPYIIDEVCSVNTSDARTAAIEVLYTDGLPASISGGAVIAAAKELAKKPENIGKKIMLMISGKCNLI